MKANLPAVVRPLLHRWLGAWVSEVDRGTLRADALAGLLGAVLVLPQAIAFVTLAGLPPQVGLYTAIVPCAVAALAGSSRYVVSGPTNALSLALLAMLAPLAAAYTPSYLELAFVVTLVVGAIQVGMALLRLGSLANFISPSVLQGFTAGAAVLIVLHAAKDLLGLIVPTTASALSSLLHALAHPQDIQPGAPLVAGVTLAAIWATRRHAPSWPAMLIGLLAGSTVAYVLPYAPTGWPSVRTVGDIPSAWPQWHVPAVDWQRLPDLLGLAAALSIVALGQSLAIAKSLAQRTGQRLDINREFLGQGLANLAGGLFSSYVACGSLNRSLPNLEAGARTPLAAVFSALALLVLVAASAPVLAHIALPAIAASLLPVAWGLLDIERWQRVRHISRRETAIAAATLAATLTMRLEIAILLGTMASLVVYLHRTARPAMRTVGFDRRPEQPCAGPPQTRLQPPRGAGAVPGDRGQAYDQPCAGPPQTRLPPPRGAGAVPGDWGQTYDGAWTTRRFVVLDQVAHPQPECPQLTMLRMEGSVYFGAVAHVADHLHALRTATPPHHRGQRHLLVMAKSMNFVDLAGAELWQAELRERRRAGGDLYFHHPRQAVLEMWQRTGFIDELGTDHIFADKRSALAAIVPRLDPVICAACPVRLFHECPPPPQPAVPPRESVNT